jgi:hypothetical protein
MDSLIRYIANTHKFTAEKYPELNGTTNEQALLFAINHSALHMSKTTGKIAAYCEDRDHGDQGNLEELKTNTAKQLINTLRLAELLGLDEEELTKRITSVLDNPVNNG